MRIALLAVVAVLSACGPGVDPLVGTFNFTLTGKDKNSVPDTSESTPTGTGTISVTPNALQTGYVITAAQTNASPCVLEGKAATEKKASPELTISAGQQCVLTQGATTVTVTFTSGKLVLTQASTMEKDSAALDVAYSYTGVTNLIFGTATFAGAGARTYAGPRR